MSRRNDRTKQKTLARERIIRLFEVAEEFFRIDPLLSANCIKCAKKISMKYRVRIPGPYKNRYCRKCFSYLMPGHNMKVRIHRKKVIITCENCGNKRRYPLSEKTSR